VHLPAFWTRNFLRTIKMQSKSGSDHYTTLGVLPDCDITLIRQAYRSMLLKLHPDKHAGNAEKFFRVQDAWYELSDPVRRKLYDRVLKGKCAMIGSHCNQLVPGCCN
jgi:curved DNA-binding protein CbpA